MSLRFAMLAWVLRDRKGPCSGFLFTNISLYEPGVLRDVSALPLTHTPDLGPHSDYTVAGKGGGSRYVLTSAG